MNMEMNATRCKFCDSLMRELIDHQEPGALPDDARDIVFECPVCDARMRRRGYVQDSCRKTSDTWWTLGQLESLAGKHPGCQHEWITYQGRPDAPYCRHCGAFLVGWPPPPRDHGPAIAPPATPASRDRQETMCGKADAPVPAGEVDHGYELVRSELEFLAAGRLSAIGNAKAIQSVLGGFAALRSQLAVAQDKERGLVECVRLAERERDEAEKRAALAELLLREAKDAEKDYCADCKSVDLANEDAARADRDRDEARATTTRVREVLREVLATTAIMGGSVLKDGKPITTCPAQTVLDVVQAQDAALAARAKGESRG